MLYNLQSWLSAFSEYSNCFVFQCKPADDVHFGEERLGKTYNYTTNKNLLAVFINKLVGNWLIPNYSHFLVMHCPSLLFQAAGLKCKNSSSLSLLRLYYNTSRPN